MSHAVLSEDESDHEDGTNLGQSRYAIVKEAWRSDELIEWLRTIDLLACGEKWNRPNGSNVAQRGNGRRLRVQSDRSKKGCAVSGLPKNCYNPVWLNSLKDYERESLDVQPPINLTFNEDERSCAFISSFFSYDTQSPFTRLAARYIPLAKGYTQPSTDGDSNPDTSGLGEWLLNKFGQVQSDSE
jgi:hypothetical protein